MSLKTLDRKDTLSIVSLKIPDRKERYAKFLVPKDSK